MKLSSGTLLKIQTWNNKIFFWHSVYQNHPFCNRKVTKTYPAEGLTLNFFFQKQFGQRHSNDSHFMSFIMIGPHVITNGDPWKKTFTFRLVMGEEVWTHVFPHILCYSIRIHGNQQAQTFEYHEASVILFKSKFTTEQIAGILYWHLLKYTRFVKLYGHRKRKFL